MTAEHVPPAAMAPVQETLPDLTAEPGRRRRVALGLLLVLLVALPGVLAHLGTREPTRTMEKIVLLRSSETWLRVHHVPAVENQLDPAVRELTPWLMPTHNGTPAATKPPMSVWLHLLAWSDLDPATTSTTTLVHRARLVAAAAGLVIVLGSFWIGHTLGGPLLALLTGLVAASTFFLQYQARLAAYDIHLAAFTTLSIACAFAAIRPMRSPPGRLGQVAGWIGCGVALGLACLTKGPVCLAAVLPPVLIALLLDGRWKRAATGLLGVMGALLVAGLVAGPWYVYLFTSVPNVQAILAEEYAATREDPDPFYYYVLMLLVVAPWNLWLIAGLFQPFVRARGVARRWLLIPWVWAALVLVIFSLPEAKKQRYLLPMMPAIALLIAHVWHAHARLPGPDPGVGPLRFLHWVALIAVSLAVALLAPLHALALHLGWIDQAIVDVPTAWATGLGVGLAILAGLGWRWHRQWKPVRAAAVTAIWMALLLPLVWQVRSTEPVYEEQHRAEAERVAALLDEAPGAPIYYFAPPGTDGKVHNDFLFYIRRVIPEIEDLPPTDVGPAFVLAEAIPASDALLTDAGWKVVDDVVPKREASGPWLHRLWRRP